MTDSLKKLITSAASCITMLSCLSIYPPAMAADNSLKDSPQGVFQDMPVVSQGDKIFIGEHRSCTVGYIDKENNLAYTAEHCSFAKEKAQVHDSRGYYVGTISSRYKDDKSYGPFRPQNIGEDFTVIEIDPTYSFLGENTYSKDKKIPVSDISRGDKMCMYSRIEEKINCGHVIATLGSTIVGSPHTNGKKGDSGGPVWIPGKGFIGVYTASLNGSFYSFSTSFEENKEDNMVKNAISHGLKSFTFSSQSSSTGKDKWYRNEKLVKKAVVSSSVLFASFVALGF